MDNTYEKYSNLMLKHDKLFNSEERSEELKSLAMAFVQESEKHNVTFAEMRQMQDHINSIVHASIVSLSGELKKTPTNIKLPEKWDLIMGNPISNLPGIEIVSLFGRDYIMDNSVSKSHVWRENTFTPTLEYLKDIELTIGRLRSKVENFIISGNLI